MQRTWGWRAGERLVMNKAASVAEVEVRLGVDRRQKPLGDVNC